MAPYLLGFLGVIVGCFLAVALYEWVKAERDERTWRRIMEEEMDSPDYTYYRLVRDDRRDSE